MVVAKVAEDARGTVGKGVLLDGRASAGARRWTWELLDQGEGAAVLTLAEEPVAVLTATEPGTYVVRLTVADGSGGLDAALTLVRVTRPTVTLEVPEEVTRYNSFEAVARTPVEVEGATYQWTSEPATVVRDELPDRPEAVRLVPEEAGSVKVTVRVLAADGQQLATADATVPVAEPVSSDAAVASYWQEQLLEADHTSLESVRESASTWQGMLTGVVGLFAALTLLGSPGLKDVGSSQLAYLAVALVAGGFVAAVVSTVLVTQLITGGVRRRPTPDGPTYGRLVKAAAVRASRALERSKLLAFVAASLLAAAGITMATSQVGGGSSGGGDAPLALVRTSTATLCGPMSTDPDTGSLLVAGQQVGRALDVQVVTACAAPEAPAQDEEASGIPPHALGVSVAVVVVGVVMGLAVLTFSWRRTASAAVLSAAAVYVLAWGFSGAALGRWALPAVVAALITAFVAWAGPEIRRRQEEAEEKAQDEAQQEMARLEEKRPGELAEAPDRDAPAP